MPSQSVHFAVAREILPDGSGAYFFGNIAPDFTDAREMKDIIHLRNRPDRRAALVELRDKIDMANDFEFGWLLHLFIDSLWDVSVVPAYHEQYTGEEIPWFRAYRSELGRLSRTMYNTLPWIPDIVQKMKDTDFSEMREMTSVLPVPLELNWFRERFLARHGRDVDNTLTVFNIEEALRFSHEAAEDFRKFLEE